MGEIKLSNPLERCMKAIKLEEPDRVPVIPLIIRHAAKIEKVSLKDYSLNPELLVQCQVAALERYGYDGIHVTSDNWILPEAVGCEITWPGDEPPVLLRSPLSDRRDIDRLRLANPYVDGRMPLRLQATGIAMKAVGDRCCVKVNFDQGPFSLASALRGIQQFFLDLHDDPVYTLELLDFCARVVAEFGVAAAKAGAHVLTFGDSVASLVNREAYERFAFPFEKRVIQEIHQRTGGVPVFLHICGDTTRILDLMAQTGADGLEIDYAVDLAFAKRTAGEVTCLEGNIAPSEVLLQAGPDRVLEEALKCIQAAGQGGGFILSSGCEVPPDAPAENILAMVRAAEVYAEG
ncbi:MAG: hypothetical protein HPY71_02845 [Firmicutes bacterium]|nr:hypothetical protein [Bacillota bacterium]